MYSASFFNFNFIMAQNYPLGNSRGRILLRDLQNGSIPPGPHCSLPILVTVLEDRTVDMEVRFHERLNHIDTRLQCISESSLTRSDVRSIVLEAQNRPPLTHSNPPCLVVTISLFSIFFFHHIS